MSESNNTATIEDSQGTKWRLRLSLCSIAEICEQLNVTLGQLTLLEVPLGPLLKSIHLLCADQIKEEGLTREAFYKRMDKVPFPIVMNAIKEAIVESFPQAAQKLEGETSGPFDLGGSKISTDSPPSPESTPETGT